jgi:hypothetical protein
MQQKDCRPVNGHRADWRPNSPGGLAMIAAIRRGSSRGRKFARRRVLFRKPDTYSPDNNASDRGQRCKKRPHECPTLACGLLSLFFC